MWIEGNLSSMDDWMLGVSCYKGVDPELNIDCELSYFTIGFGLFSVSFIRPSKD